MIKQTYTLELDIRHQSPIKTEIILTQGDNRSNIFEIHIKDGNRYIDYLQVERARIVFAKPDKTVVQGELAKAESDFIYELGTNEIAAVGEVVCSVLLYGAVGERLTTSKFTFRVVADLLTPSAVESSTEIDALQRVLAELEQLKQEYASSSETIKTLIHSKESSENILEGLPAELTQFTAKFKAAADYAEGDFWWGGYTAIDQRGNPLPDKAFISGNWITGVEVDTVSRILQFSISPQSAPGGGNGGVGAGYIEIPTAVGTAVNIRSSSVIALPSDVEGGFKNGDTFLMTFFIMSNDDNKNDNEFTISYAINDIPSLTNEFEGTYSVYYFKEVTGEERKLEIFVDLSNGVLKAATDSMNLWLVRIGYMPSFGRIKDIFG